MTLQAASSIQSIVLSKGLQSAHTTGLKTGREGTDSNTVRQRVLMERESQSIRVLKYSGVSMCAHATPIRVSPESHHSPSIRRGYRLLRGFFDALVSWLWFRAQPNRVVSRGRFSHPFGYELALHRRIVQRWPVQSEQQTCKMVCRCNGWDRHEGRARTHRNKTRTATGREPRHRIE